MNKAFRLVLSFSVLTVMWAGVPPAPALADTEVTLQRSGITAIGAYANRAWAVTLSLRGCSWRALGPAPLEDNLIVRGTSGDDTINVLQNAALWCSRWFQPIAQNGFFIQVYGGRGNDLIYGGGSAPFSGNPNAIFGEEGDDILYAGPGGVRVEGGPGADVLFGGDSPGDVLIGGPGADALCEQEEITPLVLDGGEDGDTSCSASATNMFVSVESVSCTPCGLGY